MVDYRILRKGVQELFPAYFALVMSTGIVSVASHVLGYEAISNALFWINVSAYILLFVLYTLRVCFFFSQFREDLSSHAKGPGLLTIVAASCILGVQFALLKQRFPAAIILWIFSLVVWLLLVYSFVVLIFIKKEKPSPETGISGAWLLLVVSSQSIAVLGTQLAPHLLADVQPAFFLTTSFYLLGFLLYIILITIIIYRLAFYPLKAEEFNPTYWIDMGAAAISTVAGTTLVKSIGGLAPFASFVPVLHVVNLLAWASATWWIPIVVVLEIWRQRQIPLNYNPGYWSMVFPLGMYTLATFRLSESMQLPFLQGLSRWFIFVAWIAWGVTFVAMCYSLLKQLFSKSGYGER